MLAKAKLDESSVASISHVANSHQVIGPHSKMYVSQQWTAVWLVPCNLDLPSFSTMVSCQ